MHARFVRTRGPALAIGLSACVFRPPSEEQLALDGYTSGENTVTSEVGLAGGLTEPTGTSTGTFTSSGYPDVWTGGGADTMGASSQTASSSGESSVTGDASANPSDDADGDLADDSDADAVTTSSTDDSLESGASVTESTTTDTTGMDSTLETATGTVTGTTTTTGDDPGTDGSSVSTTTDASSGSGSTTGDSSDDPTSGITGDPMDDSQSGGDGEKFCRDLDDDGQGDPDVCERFDDVDDVPLGWVRNWQDCDDQNQFTAVGAAERELLGQCTKDADGDGYGDDANGKPFVAGTDCDDAHDRTYPGAAEDEPSNCDGVPCCHRDRDDDGLGDAEPMDPNIDPGLDCDDRDAEVGDCTAELVLELAPQLTIPKGGSVKLETSTTGGSGHFRWSWSPTVGLDDPETAQPRAQPEVTVRYTVTLVDERTAEMRAASVDVRVDIEDPLFERIQREPKTIFASGRGPMGIGLADFNLDGKPDIAVVDSWYNKDSEVAVYLNTTSPGTTPSFGDAKHFPSGRHSYDLVLEDINADGKIDIVTGNQYNIWVLLNTTPAESIDITFAEGVEMPGASCCTHHMASADFNLDGKIDVIPVSYNNNRYNLYLNATEPDASVPSFEMPQYEYSEGGQPRGVAAGHLDADELPDFVVANVNGGTVAAFRNRTEPGSLETEFAPAVTELDAKGYAVGLGDFDRDGRLDVVVGTELGTSIFRNLTEPGATHIQLAELAHELDSAGPVYHIVTEDMDSNGTTDLLVTNSSPSESASRVQIFYNFTPAGSSDLLFAPAHAIVTKRFPWEIAVDDLNADGQFDFVVSNYHEHSVSVFEFTGGDH